MKKILLFLLLPLSAFSQRDTSFWFAAPDVNQFLVGNPHDRPILLRLTAFNTPAAVTVSIPSNSSFTPITINIPANSSGNIDLSNWADLVENSVANSVADKGILIRASADITAYYEIVSNCNCNPELFSLKGRNALGTEFIIPSQTEWPIDSVRFPQAKAAFDILATEDNTVINITPRKRLVGRLPGIPFTITLNRGQTFSNQALYRNGISLLNGSIVTSSKPIAVTTYEDLLMADGPCADLAGDQLIPTAIWGSEFVVVKGDLTNKDKIVITAAMNGTAIFLNGNATASATINRGNSYEINLSAQPVSYIKTNNKVSVYHYSGVNCEIGSAVIPKINCTGSNDVAITRSINEDAVVFITTRTGNQSSFTVNGNPAVLTAADFSPVPGSAGSYVFCKKNLNAVMPTGSSTRFINNAGKFQLGFLNGASPADLTGCRYGFFSDFKSSNVTRSQIEICRSDSAQLNAFGGISYQWSPSAGLSNTMTANPKASPNATTDYKVIITTAEGCIDSAFVKIIVNTNCTPTAVPCNNWLNTPSQPSWVNIGDVDVPGNQLTVEALVNIKGVPPGGSILGLDVVSKHTGPSNVNYLLRSSHAELSTTNGYFFTPDPCDLEMNKTYHLAMVYNGSTLKYYRNGYLMGQVAATGNMIQSDLPTGIGFISTLIQPENFIGFINDVRIWNVARTQAEINANMNVTLANPAIQPGLVAYYLFDNLLNKQGNNAFNGTLVGNAAINQTNPDCTFIADSCNVVTSCNNDFSYQQNICNPLSIQFNSLGPAPAGTYWNFGDGNTTTSNLNPVHVYIAPGNYTVKYGFQNGSCTDTVTKTITVNVLTDNIILTPDTTICSGSTKQLRSIPSLNFCWSPTTYLNNPLLANPVTSAPVSITYYLNAEVTGTNVITNGNFNAGNTGFTSAYNFAANNTTEGEYFVGPSPQAWNAALSNCGDHTTGSGNMLLVNGSPVPNVKVWTQTVPVTPNTNYAFSSWIQALYPPNPAQLSFSINGADVGTLITASLPTCNWTQFYTTWNSGSNTSALISIVNKNTIVLGNDFALDDISFAPVFIKRDSVKITVDTPFVRTIADTAACLNTGTILTTTGASTYSWTPATGLSATNIASPVAMPAVATQYFVTGTNAFGCVAKDTVNVSVKPAPVITKSPNDTICVLQSAQLAASGGVSYSWSPAGTLNNPSIPNPVATPSGTTTYTVTVTGANTCTGKDSIKISIDTALVNTIGDTAACLNSGTLLSTSGAVQYSWLPVTGLNAANIASPLATPVINTQYVVTGTTAAGCIDTDTVNVTVKPLPVIAISPANAICFKDSIQITALGGVGYAWQPSLTLNNPSVSNPVASPVSTTTYTVTVTGANNCSRKDSVLITVRPLPIVSKSADDTICITQSAQLNASGGTSYSWSPAASLSNAGIPNPVATPAANTVYYVTVTGANSCRNKDSISIRVNPLPVFSVSADASTCVNGKAQLSASGGNSYLWSPASLLNNSVVSNPAAMGVPSNTLFTVIIRDNVCNLQQTLSTMVRTDLIPPAINASKQNDIDCVFPASQLNVSGADTYSWSPATGLSGTNISNPLAQPAASTLYTVEGVNNFTNCKSTDTITVLVKAPAPPAAYIPNSFTPNGDGNNDCFRVLDFGTIKTREVIIYNRWGNLVFQTKNATDCWDGYYKGQPAEAGNYVYYIRVLNDCGEEIKKGNLLLLR